MLTEGYDPDVAMVRGFLLIFFFFARDLFYHGSSFIVFFVVVVIPYTIGGESAVGFAEGFEWGQFNDLLSV